MGDCASREAEKGAGIFLPHNPDHAIGPTKLVKPPAAAVYLLTDFLDQLDRALIGPHHYNEDELRGLLRVYRALSMELANLEAEA